MGQSAAQMINLVSLGIVCITKRLTSLFDLPGLLFLSSFMASRSTQLLFSVNDLFSYMVSMHLFLHNIF